MKKFFKYFILIVVCVSCSLACNSLLSPTIVGITKGSSNGIYDTYIIRYSNGKTDSFVIKNGEDAESISIDDLYIATKTAKGYGDEYTLLDFIKEYLSLSLEEKDETKAYLGALSTVEVYCEYTTSVLNNGKGLNMGAGVIYQPAGESDNYYIITNYHVVYSSESKSSDKIATQFNCFLYGSNVEITTQKLSLGGYSITYGADAIKCSYVGGSVENDIAVLKVNEPVKITNSNARPVKVCTTAPVVGETAIAIGNPQGLGTSITKGIVSVDSEYMTMTANDNVTQVTYRAIRIDASVNSGNSGGGLFNIDGELIGIVNSKLQDTGIEGMAFALPVNNSIRVADNIILNAETNNKKAIKPVFGITIKIASSKAEYNAETCGIQITEEIEIEEINDDSICKDKLAVGDKLVNVTINGVTYNINRNFTLKELTWIIKKNSVVVFNVIRMGTSTIVPIVVDESCFIVVD